MVLTTACEIKYSTEVKQFWTADYKLFHGRFQRFMRGPKNMVKLLKVHHSVQGSFEQQVAKLNLSVPDYRMLKTQISLADQSILKPGILMLSQLFRCFEQFLASGTFVLTLHCRLARMPFKVYPIEIGLLALLEHIRLDP